MSATNHQTPSTNHQNTGTAALYDDRPVPKIIDFGVAKATGQQLTERTLHTGFGAVVGTVEYMSPEQATFNQLDIDTRSDIYALGVLLYELLAGSPPFSRKVLEQAGMLEMLRMIREEEPSKPSTKLSTADGLPTLAANRGTEPAKLTKLVRGELDWIVMKALEKDRSRRYETANGFAQDVQRYLADEPVLACPPSAWYRFRKFARRNKGAVFTSSVMALAVLMLVVLLVGFRYYDKLHGAYDAETKARQAEAEAGEQKERYHYYHRIALVRLALPYNHDQAKKFLDQCPSRFRQWEWHYLHGLFHADVRTFQARSSFSNVAYSPDGKHVAFGAGDGRVYLREAATGNEVLVFIGHLQPIASVAFSKDGKRLASAASGRFGPQPRRGDVKIWDATTGKESLSITATEKAHCESVAFHPDGKSLAGARGDGSIVVWDVNTGREEFSLTAREQGVTNVAFSPDGKYLAASGHDSLVHVWDISNRKLIHSLAGHVYPVQGVAFSPDGKQISSAGWDGTVKVWNSSTGENIRTLRGHTNMVVAVAYCPDGTQLVSSSADQTVKLWDAATGQELSTYRGHDGSVFTVAFSPCGKHLMSVGSERTIKIWDATRNPEALVFRGHTKDATGAAFSIDGTRLVTVGMDNTVRLWDVAGGRELRRSALSFSTGSQVSFSPGGVYLAAAPTQENVIIKVWDVAANRELHTLRGHNQAIFSTAFSADGKRLASASYDKTVRVWDVPTGKEVLTLQGFSEGQYCAAFSPDGKRLASGGMDQTIQMWDLETGQKLLAFPRHTARIMSLCFSLDGKQIVSVSGDDTAKVWDTVTGQPLFSLVDRNTSVRCAAFTPDGQRLASGNLQWGINLWDATNGENVFAFPRQNSVILGSDF